MIDHQGQQLGHGVWQGDRSSQRDFYLSELFLSGLIRSSYNFSMLASSCAISSISFSFVSMSLSATAMLCSTSIKSPSTPCRAAWSCSISASSPLAAASLSPAAAPGAKSSDLIVESSEITRVVLAVLAVLAVLLVVMGHKLG